MSNTIQEIKAKQKLREKKQISQDKEYEELLEENPSQDKEYEKLLEEETNIQIELLKLYKDNPSLEKSTPQNITTIAIIKDAERILRMNDTTKHEYQQKMLNKLSITAQKSLKDKKLTLEYIYKVFFNQDFTPSTEWFDILNQISLVQNESLSKQTNTHPSLQAKPIVDTPKKGVWAQPNTTNRLFHKDKLTSVELKNIKTIDLNTRVAVQQLLLSQSELTTEDIQKMKDQITQDAENKETILRKVYLELELKKNRAKRKHTDRKRPTEIEAYNIHIKEYTEYATSYFKDEFTGQTQYNALFPISSGLLFPPPKNLCLPSGPITPEELYTKQEDKQHLTSKLTVKVDKNNHIIIVKKGSEERTSAPFFDNITQIENMIVHMQELLDRDQSLNSER